MAVRMNDTRHPHGPHRRRFFAVLGLTALLALGASGLSAASRTRREVPFPELPGYLTLRCDFHMHTVFSDGAVWPTLRVEEAWRDGLDVIAITDHNEYQRYKEDIPPHLGRAYEVALPLARELGLHLVRAAEITRGEPPGHLNALFLQDIAAVNRDDSREAVKSAAAQGAFIFWNHPGWKQPNRQSVWYAEQEEFFRQGWLKGLEIVNGPFYDPIAHGWAGERSLTMLADSDVHDLISWRTDIDRADGKLRPMTLVFASAKTDEALKEALLARRTIVFANAQLCGEEALLRTFVQNCLEVVAPTPILKGKTRGTLQLRNRSATVLQLNFLSAPGGVKAPSTVDLAPGAVTAIDLTNNEKAAAGTRPIILPCLVTNALTGPGKSLRIELKVPVQFVP